VTLVSGYRGLAESFLSVFHQAGHQLSVLVRRAEALGDLRQRFPDAYFHVGDITDSSAGQTWIDETIARYGTIDCLINNAAIMGPGGRLHELDFTEIQATIEANLLAPIALSQKVLPLFSRNGKGIILYLSGGGATSPRPFFSPYAVTKTAIVRLTENLAAEYPELRFYALSPGALHTPMMEALARMDPQKIGAEQQQAAERCRAGGEDPNKAAELALWLFNERPSRLNGKTISAVWDDYRKAPEYPAETGWWTLRRVDEVCIKKLKLGSSAAGSSENAGSMSP
jgi:NAD(P)-dependent dehydrogenase (short-subunit alcohol dehydrogenase family)